MRRLSRPDLCPPIILRRRPEFQGDLGTARFIVGRIHYHVVEARPQERNHRRLESTDHTTMNQIRQQHRPARARNIVLSICALAAGLFAAGFLNDWPLRLGRQQTAIRDSSDPKKTTDAASPDKDSVSKPNEQPKPEGETGEDTPETATAKTDQPKPEADGSGKQPAKPPKENPKEPTPWQAAFDAVDEASAFSAICFDDFSPRIERPQQEDLKKWFSLVPGQRLHLHETHTEVGPSASFDGVMRLQMPWREDVALRLSLTRHDRLAIHVFNGLDGVTLMYYARSRDMWAAYVTTRRSGQPKPETYALAATDETRAWRTNIRQGGTIELRCRGGEVILSRGDIILLRAPLDGLPEEVYFEGKVTFHGIAAGRTRDFPAKPEPRPIAFETDRPAELQWTERLAENARFEKLQDGAVKLSSNAAEQSSWIATPIPKVGIHEVVVQIDEATPGTGVYLGREEGQPKEIVRFARDRRTGRLCVMLREDELYEHDFRPVNEHLVPVASEPVWIRLFFASGSLRWWISADGVNWAVPDLPMAHRSGGISHIGLHCVSKKDKCAIRLRRLELRRLPEFSTLADAALAERAPAITDAPNVGVWLAKATEAQPDDVALDDWRRACAVRVLTVGGQRVLDMQLVELLLDDAAERGWPLDRQRALLDEATQLLDIRDDHGRLVNLVRRYHNLGTTALKQANDRPFSWIRQSLMSVPMTTPYDIKVADEENIRVELMQLCHNGRWREALDLCQQLQYFKHIQRVPLAGWAEATALRNLPRDLGENRITQRKEDWQHPLIDDISKDAYNALAELQAILDSGAPDDAARIVMNLDAEMLNGTAPHTADRNLLVSLPTAVRLLLNDHPELGLTINERFAQAARFRVRQAIREDNAAAIELATSQFAGSETAAEAHWWLGDRALSNGWFPQALSQYRQAAESCGVAMRRELLSRQMLAAALMGNQLDETKPEDVSLGQLQLTGAEFDALIAEQLKRTQPSTSADATVNGAKEELPAPTGLHVHNRNRLDGPVGKDPQVDAIPNAARYDIDWAGRQLAVTVDRDLMFVSNRFQLAAYDLNNGQRKWRSQAPSDKPLRSQDWGLIKMRPLVIGDSVLVRMLYDEGPILVATDRNNGQAIWRAQTPSNLHVVSDPVVVQGQLAVLTVARNEQRESLLGLSIIDRHSGRILRRHDLVRLSEAWWRRRCCEITPLDDGLIAVLSGVTLCCDLAGNTRWIRRHVVLPPSEEPGWVTQHFGRSLVAYHGLFVVQPGVRAVERLDPRTGRLAWSTLLPSVQGILGTADGRLIVHVDEGMMALDCNTGQELWKHPADDLLEAALCDDQKILYANGERPEDKQNVRRPRLTWLDPATGEPTASTTLPAIDFEDPRLGPMIVHKGNLWTFYGRGRQDATRDVLQLIPQGEAETPEKVGSPKGAWTKHIPAELHNAAADMFAGWQILSAEPAEIRAIEPEWHGQHDVLATRSKHDTPVTIARKLSVPEGGKPLLRLMVGNEPGQHWQLEVRLNGNPVHTHEFTAQSDPQHWKSVEIDLSPVAGQSGWLVVEGKFKQGGDHAAIFWKRIEIVF